MGHFVGKYSPFMEMLRLESFIAKNEFFTMGKFLWEQTPAGA